MATVTQLRRRARSRSWSALAIEHALGHAWTAPPAPWESPVLWLGGAIGVAFVAHRGDRRAAPRRAPAEPAQHRRAAHGRARSSDLFFPTPGTHVGWQLVAGVVLTGVAVAFAATAPAAASRHEGRPRRIEATWASLIALPVRARIVALYATWASFIALAGCGRVGACTWLS